MKTMFSVLCGLGCWWVGGGTAAIAGDSVATNATLVRVGIYDSRAVAYACFWSEAYQGTLREQMTAARAAKQAGDSARFKELDATLRQTQDQLHRQVFSTAPADDALAVIKERIPEIERQSGVIALVSKWDEQALTQYKDAGKVDVTDRLVREFKPTKKQQKVIADLQTQKPMALEKCNELIRQGKI